MVGGGGVGSVDMRYVESGSKGSAAREWGGLGGPSDNTHNNEMQGDGHKRSQVCCRLVDVCETCVRRGCVACCFARVLLFATAQMENCVLSRGAFAGCACTCQPGQLLLLLTFRRISHHTKGLLPIHPLPPGPQPSHSRLCTPCLALSLSFLSLHLYSTHTLCMRGTQLRGEAYMYMLFADLGATARS